jgi:hypothetical protein
MTKDEATKKFNELGGDSRTGNAPMFCMPIKLQAIQMQDKELTLAEIDRYSPRCRRDCCKYQSPRMYQNEGDWEVLFPYCGWGEQ